MKKVIYMLAMIVLLLAGAQQSAALQTVQGEITSNTTWSEDVLLQGPVFIRAGATVTVSPGVTVYGEKASVAALIIDRGAKLNAIGTANQPVVFTTDQSSPQRGDWGGLIINGYSTLNVTGGTKEGEGDTGTFGCSGSECNEADSSGTLQYVRVEYGGIQFSPDNELNGIAFQGTGSGTIVDHVQVHYSKDDCIEFFGGTTNLKYAIMTACGDDSLDWTDGWRGNAQFLVVQQKGDEADNGVEADNLDKANDNEPRSNPTIYNMTMIGDPILGEGSTHGLTLRRGTAGTLKNFVVMGFKKSGVRFNNEATFQQIDAGTLVFDNSIFHSNNPNYDAGTCDKGSDGACTYTYPYTAESFMASTMQNNREADPLLGSPYDLDDPDFRPGTGSPALTGAATVPSGSFFEPVNFVGAVDPDNDWTRAPWTSYGTADWTACTDGDGDGYGTGSGCLGEDCDDANAGVNPGASEDCGADGAGNAIDDNCDGEVDEGCDAGPGPNPCAATALLGAESAGLQTLRTFRDTLLARTATGSLYTQLYYQYTAEAVAIMMADASLMQASQSALARMLPIVEAALQGKRVQLSSELAREIITILDKLNAKASIGLKIAIFKAKTDIASGDLPF